MTTLLTAPQRVPVTATLRRLLPFVRPILPYLAVSILTAGVATLAGLAIPIVLGRIVDGPIASGNLSELSGPLLWLFIVLGISEAGLFCVRRLLVSRPVLRVEHQLRNTLYEQLQHLPIAWHDRWPVGQLLSRATSDLSTIRRFLGFGLVFLVVNLSTLIFGVYLLIHQSLLLGLVIAALAVPLILLSTIFERKYQVLARRSQDLVGDVATLVEESVQGIRILKSFGRSAQVGTRFRALAQELRQTERAKARMLSILWAVIIMLPEIALGACLFLGVGQVAAGQLTAGALVAFFGIAMGLRWPIQSLGWLLALANDTASATARYFEVLDAKVDIASPVQPHEVGQAGEIVFRDVSFAFADAPDKQILHQVNLTVAPGETVAIVGATGSGKTTLTTLVNRLQDVTGGQILLDGVDIRQIDLDVLRQRVAVAFEEPTLFSASVRENVLLGYPEGTDEQVRQALSIAQADFVDDLPWGLDTRIGEQGMSLSGGQRQRLALARAVVGKPSVLVLDDPLSALDIHTESQVEKALRTVLGSTTALVVAHRASTVMLADRVALLADGRICAVGTHSHLMATSPAYAALLRSDTTEPEA